jgi:hypothetical protein
MRASLESFATAVASLSPTARLLLEVLSNVEEVDRSIGIARPALTWFWQGFGHAGPPLPFDAAVAELQQCGFVAVLGAGATEEYRIPPPVIDLTRALTDPTHTKRILTSIGATWAEQFQRDAGAPGPRTVRAGMGAAVYLKRMGSFADSFTWFEAVLEVAKATGEAWHVVPHLYLLALASGDANLAARLEELEQRGALDAKRAGP